MSVRCPSCFYPVQNCYCRYIVPIRQEIRFVFLMHPVEAYRQRTGTGRLASLSLEGSEIVITETPDSHSRFRTLLADPEMFWMVLYPGKEALPAGDTDFRTLLGNRRPGVILIDGTWNQARKMMHRNGCLRALPRLSFSGRYLSRFSIKTQPASYCLSTIESAYYLIRELQAGGFCDSRTDPEGLMEVFQKMVRFQEESRLRRFEANRKKGSPTGP